MPTFSLAGQLRFQPTWTDTLSTTDVVDSVEIIRALTLSNGTGAGQANAYWRDVRTVAATTTDIVDLSALPLSVFGGSATLDLTAPRLIYVRNLSASVRLLYALIEGSNQEIPPGGIFLWTAPVDATGGKRWLADSQLIEVENTTATSGSYEIVLVGEEST